jgi:hypothetical protein
VCRAPWAQHSVFAVRHRDAVLVGMACSQRLPSAFTDRLM